MLSWSRLRLLLIFTIGFAWQAGFAQTPGLVNAAKTTRADESTETASGLKLRVTSNLVLIPVTVTDPSNRFVLGLEKQDFQVLEDNVPQNITHFAGEDVPLSVGLLVDVSGSMGLKLDTSRQAVRQFLRTMNNGDEAFLIEFSDRADLALGFTSNTAEVEEKLSSLRPGGLTALLDAVHMGLNEMKKAKNPRKALLIISDGGDNNSQYTAAAIKDSVQAADVQIYAMGVFEPTFSRLMPQELISGPRLLSELAQETGGRAYPATTFSVLPNLATQIGIELRNQYVLAYSSTNHKTDGSYRHVEVKLQQPAALPALKARWRVGYYGPTD